MFDNQKNHLGTIIIAKDITSIKNTERELVNAKDKAEAANKAKSTFLANMSHEIRTPLNGMLGFIELLSHTTLTESQQGYLNIVKTSGHSLGKLLNDILDLTKVESGKLIIEKVNFNLYEIAQSCFHTFRLEGEKKGLDVRLTILPKQNIQLNGDPNRITQIITNLLGNAVKFTEEGFVNLSIVASDEVDNKIPVQIEIFDTGVGIPKNVQNTMFDTFTQGDNTSKRKFGGSGLGLSITKHLVELMKGSISVQSPITTDGTNIGTKFTVNITFDKAEEVIAPISENTGKLAFGDGFNVLIVDDNDINLLLAKKILSKLNATIETAKDGKESVEKGLKKVYDVILMDIQMPEMDGYEATEILRENGYTKPIIALSANVYEDDINKCYKSGMNGHIGKPFSSEQIFNKINKILSESTSR